MVYQYYYLYYYYYKYYYHAYYPVLFVFHYILNLQNNSVLKNSTLLALLVKMVQKSCIVSHFFCSTFHS